MAVQHESKRMPAEIPAPPPHDEHDYKTIQVHPLTGILGAEISGVDLSVPLRANVAGEIKQALIDHLVIVFRDQVLTPEQYKSFAQNFGTPDTALYGETLADDKCLQVLDLNGHGSLNRTNFILHIDESAEEIPNKYTFLYPIDLPAAGGDTLFSNLYTAYETLTEPMRTFLSGLSSLHGRIARNEWAKIIADQDPELLAKRWSRYKQLVAHPLVCTHPDSGRKYLFFNPNRSVAIPELSLEESEPLMSFLREHVSRPEFGCRVTWQPKSLLMWDNLCTIHKAMKDFWIGRRRMLRIEISDEIRPS